MRLDWLCFLAGLKIASKWFMSCPCPFKFNLTYHYCSNLWCHPSFLVPHYYPSSIVKFEPATIYIILSHSAILLKVLFTYQLDPILFLKFIYLQQHSLPLYKAVFTKTVFGKHNFENILASVRALAPSE